MTPNVHMPEAKERQLAEAPEQLPSAPHEAPSARAPEEMASRQESRSPMAAPPHPPHGGLAARLQRMPEGWRWALGLALAFLSSLVPLLLSSITFGDTSGTNIDITSPAIFLPMVLTSVGVIVAFVLAAAAGFVLTRWLAVVALAATAIVGAFAGSVAVVQLSPTGSVEGLTGMNAALVLLAFFGLLFLAPLILVFAAGVGLGKQQGLTFGQAPAISERQMQVGRWIAALAPVVAAGLLSFQLGNMPGMLGMRIPAGTAGWSALPGVLYATVLAATCLLAGWLLRSWWALVVAPLAYAVAAAVVSQIFAAAEPSNVWTLGFALYILAPAVVMAAIGTAIGKVRVRRSR